jgi:hypothetical protein
LGGKNAKAFRKNNRDRHRGKKKIHQFWDFPGIIPHIHGDPIPQGKSRLKANNGENAGPAGTKDPNVNPAGIGKTL